ncbi:hypothetical protein GN958_ATG12058 [Phytophthora infestans]|uniref:Uncharacterized protein n=1 Tax=Phytophthora infestans TaxID=4787 RepID=A0A8S9UE13_PHYIN|nr:hypothetical protein GN958_ATG12058 [Phytophthora infestans]
MSAIITVTPCRVTGGRPLKKVIPQVALKPPRSSSKKSGTTPTVEDQLRSRLDDEDREADDATLLHFMIEFWSRLRAVLAANSHSVGLDALDRQVLRLIADDTLQAPLESAVVILPSPDSMSAGQVREHSVFQAPVTETRFKRSNSRTPHKPPPAKKQRTSKKAKAKRQFSFDLPAGVDATIERDLERLMKISEGEDSAAARRKFEASALQARLQLLSAFCEEMGYYGMLTALEDTVHDNLMWFGGRTAKHASGANDDSKSPAQEDLGVLFKRHHRQYDQVIANALDPFEVDSSGYRSIPELLETSQAIDPTILNILRLSDKAWLASLWTFLAAILRKRAGSAAATVAMEEPFEQGEDDSDFEENGELTALKSSPPVKCQPPNSPTKHLAYYLGLSSDEEDQEQEEGHPSKDHDDEEDKETTQEDTYEDADDQDDDDEAAENPTSTDNGAASDAGDMPSKTSKPSSTSPDSQTPN